MLKRNLRRILAATAGTGLSVVLCAGPVAALPTPDSPPAGSVPFVAGEVCDFPVLVNFWGTQKPHDQGAVDATGRFIIQIVNQDSGAQVTLNASGPSLRGGAVEVGPWVVFQPASRNVGPAFLIYHRGHTTFTEQITIDTIHGHTVDVCALLS